MKHVFTVTAEYANGFDGKIVVEIFHDGAKHPEIPIGEGYADTPQDAVALAFKNLELPSTRG